MTIVPSEITANLDATGHLSQAVTSNLDPGTIPAAPGNTQWRVDIRILGAQVETYNVTVPPIQVETNGSSTAGSETVVLSSLTAALFMVGQSISGSNIPVGATITAVNVSANSVTISAPASGTGTGLTLTIGATIDLGALLPTAVQAG